MSNKFNEPWEAQKDSEDNWEVLANDRSQAFQCTIGMLVQIDEGVNEEAFAERIEKSVNAMAGVDDPALLMRIVRKLAGIHKRCGGMSSLSLDELVDALSRA